MLLAAEGEDGSAEEVVVHLPISQVGRNDGLGQAQVGKVAVGALSCEYPGSRKGTPEWKLGQGMPPFMRQRGPVCPVVP